MQYSDKSFSYLPFEGPVKLKNPDITLYYIEYYGLNPNDIPEEPHEYFFGRWVSNVIVYLPLFIGCNKFYYRLPMVSES